MLLEHSEDEVQRRSGTNLSKRTVKAVLRRSGYLEFGQALVAETVANVGQEELAF